MTKIKYEKNKIEEIYAELEFENEKGAVERGTWDGNLEFLLSCLGYAVGLGNVWRFPYLCFKNGGGSFLVPYFLMLLVIGIPAFLMELHIGQYSAMGPSTVYAHLSPLFKGLGFANIFSQCFIGIYYNIIIAWTIHYLFSSFTADLPWQHCDNDYNDQFCFSISEYKECELMKLNKTFAGDVIYLNRTCITNPDLIENVRQNKVIWYGSQKVLDGHSSMKVKCVYINTTYCDPTVGAEYKISKLFDLPVHMRKSSSAQYFSRSVLAEADSIEPHNFTSISGNLVLSLLAAWFIVFLCCLKGIKSSGKVVYFTAIFPYVVLIILLVRAVTLPGASHGLYFYLVPQWSKLSSISVWEAAAVQIFFSLSIGGGGLITLSSYNTFHNNILKDTLIVCVGNCLTSFVAGFAIFSVLGFMAHELGVPVEDVAKGGTGLAFEAYPDLVTRLPVPTLWSILFFLMLFTLGLDSQFAIVETILTGILDYCPNLRPRKTMVVAGVCFLGFFVGLPFCCPGGSYLLDLVDYYAASWPFLFIALMEFIIVVYIYGYSTFIHDIFEMTRSRVVLRSKSIMSIFYCFLSPAAVLIILLASWWSFEPLKKGDYIYPSWANAVGWVIALTSILAVPTVSIFLLTKSWAQDYSLGIMGHLTNLWQHTEDWRHNALNNHAVDGDNSEYEYRMEGGRKVRIARTRWEDHCRTGADTSFVCSLDTFNREGFSNIFGKEIEKEKVRGRELLNQAF